MGIGGEGAQFETFSFLFPFFVFLPCFHILYVKGDPYPSFVLKWRFGDDFID